MKLNRCIALAALAGFAAPALAAPPTFVLTGQLASDLSADGQTAAGANFDPITARVVVAKYTLGIGTLISGLAQNNDSLRCSDDGSIIAYPAYDLENVSGLGSTRLTPHVWNSLAGTETNYGIAPFTFSCDAFTNSVNDLSGNGRYIVGGAYTARVCGPYRAYRLDTLTDTWEQLPTIPGSRDAAAYSVNADGTVICGRDDMDPGAIQLVRTAVVWVKDGATWTRTVLDATGGKANAVSADGNTVVGQLSDSTPVRWTRSGATWTPEVLSFDASMVPLAVSADGSTVAGSGGDDYSGFIWRQSINSGVAVSLAAYVSENFGQLPPYFSIMAYGGSPVRAISADGNSLLISLMDETNPCLTWFPSAILDLDGGACEPARVAISPVSQYNPEGPINVPFGMTFNCFITGSIEMDIQWQKETSPGSNTWTDLEDDNCQEINPDSFNVRGTQTMQLRLGALDNTWAGRYRCVVTNSCGSEASRTFRVTTCLADLTCDQFVDLNDYFQFFNAFDQTTDEADMNDDGIVDLNDFFDFLNAFDASC